MENNDSVSEEWRDVEGYEGLYQVSNLGRCKRLKSFGRPSERVLKPKNHIRGYHAVDLSKDGKRKTHLLHRIIAVAFYGASKLTVDHKNTDKHDNRLDNL